MCYFFFIGFMCWLDESENNYFDVMKVFVDSWVGYILEVDLEYLLELYNDYDCYFLVFEYKIV